MSISKGTANRTKRELAGELHKHENRSIGCFALYIACEFLKDKFPPSSLVGPDGAKPRSVLEEGANFFMMCVQQAEARKASIIEQLKNIG